LASLRLATRRLRVVDCPSGSPPARLAYLHYHHQRRAPEKRSGDEGEKGGVSTEGSAVTGQESEKKKKKKVGARPFLDSLLGLLGRKPPKQEEEDKQHKNDTPATDATLSTWTPAVAVTETTSAELKLADWKPEKSTSAPTIKSHLVEEIPYWRYYKAPKSTKVVFVHENSRWITSQPNRSERKYQWRQFDRRAKQRNPGMKSYIQFVTVPTGDTAGTCILFHHDNRRYLFGHLGEGTMRACNESTLSLRKVQKMFISGKMTRETTGGLLGMLLTLADANAHAASTDAAQQPGNAPTKGATRKITSKADPGEPSNDVEVYGPPNLVHSVAAARKFIFRKSTPTTIRDLEDQPPERRGDEWLPRVLDSNVDVFTLVVKPHETATPGSGPAAALKSLARDIVTKDPVDDDTKNLIRQRVINDMFNSKWRLDTLVEKYLHEIDGKPKMWVRNPETKDMEEYIGPMPPNPSANKFLKVFVRNPWPASTIQTLPSTTPRSDAVSYIVRGRMARGKFDKTKALALGLKPGPMFTKLAQGEELTLDDGRIIKPEDVLGANIQSGGFAVLDVPSEEYVEPLLAREELASDKVMAGVSTYIWILGPEVSGNSLLQQFIKDRSKAEHVITSLDHNANTLVAHGAASSAIKLAQVDREHFPIPYFENDLVPQPNFRRDAGFLPQQADQQADLFAMPNVRVAQRGLTIELDPARKVNESTVIPDLDTLSLITSPQSQEVIDLAREVRISYEKGPLAAELAQWRESMKCRDAEIITLGTGSAMPSKYRNVSATLVRVPDWGSYLLDAGENTLGQLQRVYKPHELVEVLRDLRMIWISHGHADHHLGTISMIKAWHNVVHGRKSDYPAMSPQVADILLEEFDKDEYKRTEPSERPRYLAVMGNKFLVDYLHEMSLAEDFGYEHVLPVIPTSPPSSKERFTKEVSIFLSTPQPWLSRALTRFQRMALLGLRRIKVIDVEHCNGAKAIFMQWWEMRKTCFSVAYSGDCRPSGAFATHGQGASVLIHEATFDDELSGEAKAKKHSTVQEAIAVAKKMKAKSLILTHFSQRYQKIPVLDDIWGKVEEVQERIERESARERNGHGTRGPGAGEDVEEVAAGADELPVPTNNHTSTPMDVEDSEDSATSDEEMEALDTKTEMPILFAFDYMRVRVGDMPMLRAYRPALTKLFESELAELEEKKAKRAEAAMLTSAGLKVGSPGKRNRAAANGNAVEGGKGKKKVKSNGSKSIELKSTGVKEKPTEDKPTEDQPMEVESSHPKSTEVERNEVKSTGGLVPLGPLQSSFEKKD
jgi:ribonuclease Z